MKLLVVFILLLFFEAKASSCVSVKGTPIAHYDFVARDNGLKKRVLVIGEIHGDEPDSGILAAKWKNRLERIKFPSNHWRIIPTANPDGKLLSTRMNANKVDLNRNFPTKDWDKFALQHWKMKQKSQPRRFPGQAGGSEPEVKCLIEHITNFRPDIIISIHTPYGLFDFDGPKTKGISKLLPWRRLGTYPGSLGRWAWDERNIPVLTIELPARLSDPAWNHLVKLQDRISDLIP